jgi:WD40 repeat protein
VKYDAFISYSHDADGRMAPAVQSALQRLAKPWYRRRALQVFRDETGLAVDPHLWASIADAMDQSRYFVLLASPEAAQSVWVNREISHWLATHPAETVLPVLTDGTLVWSDRLGDYDPELSTALPPALAGVYASEPRHLDLRWAHEEDQLDPRHSRFRAEVAVLAAAIHGVAPEDLESDDVRLHRRTMRLAGAAIGALAVLTLAALVSAGLAVSYAATAQRNEERAIETAEQARLQRSAAVTNASLARDQRGKAEANALRAARNQAEAEEQEALAQANADQAEANAAEAHANADEAEANAEEAARNSDEARANAARAAANAQEAQANAAAAQVAAQQAQANADRALQEKQRADENAAEARAEKERAEANAVVALARQLAATARNTAESDYDTALLQAVAAYRLSPTVQARDSLVRVLLARPEIRTQFRLAKNASRLWISPDGRTIAAGGGDGGVELWDARTGRHRATFLGGRFVFDAALGGNETLAAVTHRTILRDGPTSDRPDEPGGPVDDSAVAIVSTETGERRFRIPYGERSIDAITLSRDGTTLAVAWRDVPPGGVVVAGIDLWTLDPVPTLLRTITRDPVPVRRIALDPAARQLGWTEDGEGDRPARAYVHDLAGDGRVGPLEIGHSFAEVIQFSEDGTTVQTVVGDPEGPVVSFWDAGTGAAVSTFTVPGSWIAASPDQRLVAILEPSGDVGLRDARTGAVVPASLPSGLIGAFTPDGTAFVSSDFADVTVVELEPEPRRLGTASRFTTPADGRATFSADGKLVAILHDTGALSIVDTADGRVVVDRPAPPGAVPERSGYFSPTNETLAVVTAGAVQLIDVQEGTSLLLPHDGEFAGAVTFSPDGRTLAITATSFTSGSDLYLWDVATGRRLPSPSLRAAPTSAVYLPDGTLAVGTSRDGIGGDEGQIELFPPSGPARVIDGYQGIFDVGADGTTLVVLDEDGMVELSLPDGKRLRRFRPFRIAGVSLAFDFAGGLGAVGNGNGTVQLFDLGTGEAIGPALAAHDGMVTGLRFTGPGRLVSAAAGDTVVRWQLSPTALMRRACDRANRELSRDEWQRMVGTTVPYIPVCAGA